VVDVAVGGRIRRPCAVKGEFGGSMRMRAYQGLRALERDIRSGTNRRARSIDGGIDTAPIEERQPPVETAAPSSGTARLPNTAKPGLPVTSATALPTLKLTDADLPFLPSMVAEKFFVAAGSRTLRRPDRCRPACPRPRRKRRSNRCR